MCRWVVHAMVFCNKLILMLLCCSVLTCGLLYLWFTVLCCGVEMGCFLVVEEVFFFVLLSFWSCAFWSSH